MTKEARNPKPETSGTRRFLARAGALAGRVAGGFLQHLAAGRRAYQQTYATYHDAARRDDTNTDWRAMLSSADQAILDELDTMLARSRQAVANDGWAASAQGGFGRYVVGGGITARASARHPTDPTVGLLRRFNSAHDRLWDQRCYTPRLVDAEQTKTMPEIQRVIMNELFAAGGVFVVQQYRPDPAGTALILQLIEYEQRNEQLYEWQGRPVRGGIEVGDYGEPLAYHLFTTSHPLEEYGTQSVRVPAAACHHLFRQDRVRQRVGTPWLKPVLLALRHLAMYQSYTMIQARARAANAGFIKQGPGLQPGETNTAFMRRLSAGAPQATSSDPELRVNVAPGLWHRLKPGEEPYLPAPGVPDTMYPPFVMEHLKQISAGTGLDIYTVSRWFADASFSAVRNAKLDLWAEIDWIQDLLFIHKICRADREEWTELVIREGRLSATGFFEDRTGLWRSAYLQTNWQGPPRRSADEIKDEAAWDMKMRGGRASPQDYFNEHGGNQEQVLSELQEFRASAKLHGVGDVVDRWLMGATPNVPKTGMQPDGTGADADPSAGGLTGGVDIGQLVMRQHILAGIAEEGGNGRGR